MILATRQSNARWGTLSLAFALLLGLAASGQQSRHALNNGDIIKMARARFTEEVIVALIEANDTEFDVSTAGLAALKDVGVGGKIMEAMLKAEATKRTSSSAAAAATPRAQPVQPSTGAPAIVLSDWFNQLEDEHQYRPGYACSDRSPGSPCRQFAPLVDTGAQGSAEGSPPGLINVLEEARPGGASSVRLLKATGYGFRALVYAAIEAAGQPRGLREIAEGENIPPYSYAKCSASIGAAACCVRSLGFMAGE